LPLALAWLGARPPRTFWDELASGAGLLAFTIILVEFVLSGRIRIISAHIGMDVTMRFHQLLARTAMVLAAIHPFLYRTDFKQPYPWDFTRQASLTSDFTALGSGVLAWVLLPAFVLLAIGRDRIGWKYETWRLMHGLGALLIAGLLLHHTLSAGRYSADPVLSAVWSGFFLIAVASLAKVYLVGPLLERRRSWKVARLRLAALNTWELTLEPDGHRGLDYEAGQFVWLNLGSSSFSLRENPFSISSAPASGAGLQFIIKELGDFTKSLGKVAIGTRAYIDGPHGNLTLSDRAEPGVVLVAGGVGVAPLLGILRQMRLTGDARPVLLLYGNRVEEQIVCPGELGDLARGADTRVVLALSEPPDGWGGHRGTVDADLICSVFEAPRMRQWLFVLCGSPAMMVVAEDCLIELGVPSSQVLSERFTYD
jgi:predicted ferric reductase